MLALRDRLLEVRDGDLAGSVEAVVDLDDEVGRDDGAAQLDLLADVGVGVGADLVGARVGVHCRIGVIVPAQTNMAARAARRKTIARRRRWLLEVSVGICRSLWREGGRSCVLGSVLSGRIVTVDGVTGIQVRARPWETTVVENSTLPRSRDGGPEPVLADDDDYGHVSQVASNRGNSTIGITHH